MDIIVGRIIFSVFCLVVMMFCLKIKQRFFWSDLLALLAGAWGAVDLTTIFNGILRCFLNASYHELFNSKKPIGELNNTLVFYISISSIAMLLYLFFCIFLEPNIINQDRIKPSRKLMITLYILILPVIVWLVLRVPTFYWIEYYNRNYWGLDLFYQEKMPELIIGFIRSLEAALIETLTDIILVPFLFRRLFQNRIHPKVLLLDILVYSLGSLVFMAGHYSALGYFDLKIIPFYAFSIFIMKTSRSYFVPIYFHFIWNLFLAIG